MKSKYTALDLAKEVVNIVGDMGLNITNLQLQKIMYYIQGNFMKKFQYRAFRDDILCWDYGPVVESVWRCFNKFGRNPIKDHFNTNINLLDCEVKLIKDVLIEKLSMNVWDLVDKTHEELPWKNAFEHENSKISNDDMERFFC